MCPFSLPKITAAAICFCHFQSCALPAQLLRFWQAGWTLYLTKLTGWTVMQLSGLLFRTWDWILKSHSTLESCALQQTSHERVQKCNNNCNILQFYNFTVVGNYYFLDF